MTSDFVSNFLVSLYKFLTNRKKGRYILMTTATIPVRDIPTIFDTLKQFPKVKLLLKLNTQNS